MNVSELLQDIKGKPMYMVFKKIKGAGFRLRVMTSPSFSPEKDMGRLNVMLRDGTVSSAWVG